MSNINYYCIKFLLGETSPIFHWYKSRDFIFKNGERKVENDKNDSSRVKKNSNLNE